MPPLAIRPREPAGRVLTLRLKSPSDPGDGDFERCLGTGRGLWRGFGVGLPPGMACLGATGEERWGWGVELAAVEGGSRGGSLSVS